jgi:hypothetical protein
MAKALRAALDPSSLLTAAGMAPDPWQREFLGSWPHRALVVACRQGAGKTTVAACGAVHRCHHRPGTLALCLCPTLRQSVELVGVARQLLSFLSTKPALDGEAAGTLRFANGSRLIALPGATPATIRGFAAPDLLIIDEASYVDDQTFFAARPTLAVSDGDLWALGTPAAKSGWFWRAWSAEAGAWARWRVPATDSSRISAEFLEAERLSMTERTYAREYDAQFTDDESAAFSADDLAASLVGDRHDPPPDRPRIPMFGQST